MPIHWFEKYLRYVDYLAAAQLYLKDNFFLKRPLKTEHIKERILGHWGTVPGQNFIYAHGNFLLSKHPEASMLFIAGPGHGAPAVFSNIFAEGTFGEYYDQYSRNAKGTAALIKDFSWPGGLPSHVTPVTPGSILEGGELGYSLATAYGAVMDNPDLIALCVVGDGEAETGPLAAAWQSNKFLNPAESGAVLTVLHDNGYKISGPTIFGAMSDREITDFFNGLWYEPFIVEGARLHEKMADAMESSYRKILNIQKRARSGGKIVKPRWPVIILRSPKGWHGITAMDGKKVEGNFRSHGIPIHDPRENTKHFKLLEKWLRSYRIEELVDSHGAPLPEVLQFVPLGSQRMGKNKHTYGGNIRKNLILPSLRDYEVLFKKPGGQTAANTAVGAKFIRDIFRANASAKNFRFFCPDETDSNKMGALFEATGRAFMWPLPKGEEWMSPAGRVMEVLSEHTLQGWLQGYLLTGRHGMFATYEAFAMIVASMVDQYAKFIKQALKYSWRKPIASLNYLLTSLGWRQEHNGYSHQNPGFVSSVLEKHGEFASVYFPPDGNSLLIALEDCFQRKNAINVIVSGKNPMPQWLTLDEARKQHKLGVGVWEWVDPEGSEAPDIVFASAGDHMTVEAIEAAKLLKKLLPKVRVRFVNVSELTSLGIGDERHPMRLGNKQFERFFTGDKPIIFNFHGYPDVIKKLVFGHPAATRFSVHGYIEEGTTTTPFDMHVRNQTSRFHLVMDAVSRLSATDESVRRAASRVLKQIEKKLTDHQKYIMKYGKDMKEMGI